MSHIIFDYITTLMSPHQRILDCGCGQGELLKQLVTQKNAIAYGIDNNSNNIEACLNKGLSVYHGDIGEGLKELPDNSFDVVVLSSTLQQIESPAEIINHMIRVAPKVLVTFPNFAYWKCRLSLVRGIIPQTKALPFTWYNTPNIRVISIKSFKKLCKELQVNIVHQSNFVNDKKINSFGMSNLLAESALFLIET